MRYGLLFGTLGTLAVVVHTAGQQPPAKPPQDCKAQEYRQFDFWIGRWDVTAQRKPAGTNHVQSDLKGCVIIEHWTASGGGRGMSFNFYDRATRSWHQNWMDERGGALRLSGGIENGSMVLRSAAVGSQSTMQRITWTPSPDGSVRQLWETSADGGKSWSVAFDGRYVKRSR